MNDLPEVDLDRLKSQAIDLDDYKLDELIAVFQARRNVAAAHGFPLTCDHWNDALIALVDVRSARTRTRVEFEDITAPVSVRPMTADELGECPE